MEEIIANVTKRVHKEYKEFIDRVLKNGKWYAIDNALKIAFYKEIHIYVLNGIVDKPYYSEMNSMDEIIETLWNRFNKNSVSKSSNHFLNQLLEFHKNNKERMKLNAKLCNERKEI